MIAAITLPKKFCRWNLQTAQCLKQKVTNEGFLQKVANEGLLYVWPAKLFVTKSGGDHCKSYHVLRIQNGVEVLFSE